MACFPWQQAKPPNKFTGVDSETKPTLRVRANFGKNKASPCKIDKKYPTLPCMRAHHSTIQLPVNNPESSALR